jgi:Nucleoside diphosphate kinase
VCAGRLIKPAGIDAGQVACASDGPAAAAKPCKIRGDYSLSDRSLSDRSLSDRSLSDRSLSHRENLVHASDSAESAGRETKLWFPNQKVRMAIRRILPICVCFECGGYFG